MVRLKLVSTQADAPGPEARHITFNTSSAKLHVTLTLANNSAVSMEKSLLLTTRGPHETAEQIDNEKRPVGRHSAKSLPDHPSLQVTETTSPVLPEIGPAPE